MVEPRVYQVQEVDFTTETLKSRPTARKVLMVTPKYFEVIDVKNVHMQEYVGATDKSLATAQWDALKAVYDQLKADGFLQEVYAIDGVAGCEDMVFTANQSFPWLQDGKPVVVMSQMRHESRQHEVPYFKKFYEGLGYQILELQRAKLFEGMGDTIPHPTRNLLFGGYGHRSETLAYEEISAMLQVPVITLELIDDRFYHLDTCFIPVDDQTVFLCKDAFAPNALATLEKLFADVVDIPVAEAEDFFALNAHCMNFDGRKVAILQQGTSLMKAELEKRGFEVFELDTSEYMKSGGSVFCMKMMLY